MKEASMVPVMVNRLMCMTILFEKFLNQRVARWINPVVEMALDKIMMAAIRATAELLNPIKACEKGIIPVSKEENKAINATISYRHMRQMSNTMVINRIMNNKYG
jgi:hypothetical protein